MPEVKVLRIKKGWRIFLYILVLIFFIFAVYMGVLPFISSLNDIKLFLILISLSLIFVSACLAGFIELIIYKVELSDDYIALRSITGFKKINSKDISGFRFFQSSQGSDLVVIPQSGKKKIKITTYTERINEIYEWFEVHDIKNLDSVDYNEEAQKLVNDRGIGETGEERFIKIKEAKLYSRILNTAGIIAAFWNIIYPRPYATAVIVCMALPLIAILILFKYKNILTFDEKKNSPRNSMASAFFIPAMAAFLRSILDYSLIDIKGAFIVSSLFFLFIAVIFLIVTFKELRKKIVLMLIMLPFIFCYSWSITVQSNCLFDYKPGDAYKTTALEKRVSSGKYTSYYVKISPAGPVIKVKEISVSRDLYSRINENDELLIYIFKGLLKIKWLYLDKEEKT